MVVVFHRSNWNFRWITLHTTSASRSRNLQACPWPFNMIGIWFQCYDWADTIVDWRGLLDGRKHLFWVSGARGRMDLCYNTCTRPDHFFETSCKIFGITLNIKELSIRFCGVKISRLVFQDQSGPPLYCNDFDTFLTLKMSWIWNGSQRMGIR